MNSGRKKIILSLTFGLLSGCASIDKSSHSYKNQYSEAVQQDGEVIAFLDAVNNHEIQAAKIIENRTKNRPVLSFAELMIKEHTKNLKETHKISKDQKIPLRESAKIVSLKDRSEKERHNLRNLHGRELENAYIDAMVKDHEEALKEIDNFLKIVNNSILSKHLVNTRQHVKHHLEKAKEIRVERTHFKS